MTKYVYKSHDAADIVVHEPLLEPSICISTRSLLKIVQISNVWYVTWSASPVIASKWSQEHCLQVKSWYWQCFVGCCYDSSKLKACFKLNQRSASRSLWLWRYYRFVMHGIIGLSPVIVGNAIETEWLADFL